MHLEEIRTQFVGRESTMREELDALGEHEMPETVNLRERHTGFPGVIFVSTRMGPHGPRVKYYPGRAGDTQPSMSISVGAEPRVLASSLSDRDLARWADTVIAWTRINHAALTEWWNERDGLEPEQIAAYVSRFEKI